MVPDGHEKHFQMIQTPPCGGLVWPTVVEPQLTPHAAVWGTITKMLQTF